MAASHDDDTGLVGCTSPPSAYFGVGGAVLQVSPNAQQYSNSLTFTYHGFADVTEPEQRPSPAARVSR